MMNTQCPLLGFTTTIPVETVFAAGYKPVDLNNNFISHQSPLELVEYAEIYGFPRSSCAWIKGLFSVLQHNDYHKQIDVFVAVTEGDCSNAKALKEVIEQECNIKTYIFNYPQTRNKNDLKREIEKFASFLGTDLESSENIRKELIPVRKKLSTLDEYTWKYPGMISGKDNHIWLVSSSDFNGNYHTYEKELDVFLQQAQEKALKKDSLTKKRLAFLGVPPIIDMYDFIEEKGGSVVLNEIHRSFAMLGDYNTIIDQYLNYIYPYSAEFRFSKTFREFKHRNIDGIIHYVQSFCHRQIEDIILRKLNKQLQKKYPILTIEGDKPASKLDGRLKTRIEAFLETFSF